MALKQVIAVRVDLKMPVGKEAGQVAHAAVKTTVKYIKDPRVIEWINSGQTKIVVCVRSEEELTNIYAKAIEAGLPASIIQDAARTVFPEPTLTTTAIGPGPSEEIDKITGHLRLR